MNQHYIQIFHPHQYQLNPEQIQRLTTKAIREAITSKSIKAIDVSKELKLVVLDEKCVTYPDIRLAHTIFRFELEGLAPKAYLIYIGHPEQYVTDETNFEFITTTNYPKVHFETIRDERYPNVFSITANISMASLELPKNCKTFWEKHFNERSIWW